MPKSSSSKRRLSLPLSQPQDELLTSSNKFRSLIISYIPILVFCVFGILAVYSFVLMRGDEDSLRNFNEGIVQQRAIIGVFLSNAQKTLRQLYELTSTAGNEVDPDKVKRLKEENMQALGNLKADQEVVSKTLGTARVEPETIASYDTLTKVYADSASDVVDMIDTDAATAMSWMTQTRVKFGRLETLLNDVRNNLTIEKERQVSELTLNMMKGRYIFTIIFSAILLIAFFLSLLLRRFVRTIDTLNMSMTAMLNSLRPGLLFFDARGICSPIYSKACLSLLEDDPAGKPITDVLKLTSDKQGIFQSAIKMLYAGKLPLGFSEFVSLAPNAYVRDNKVSIDLEYRPINGPDGSLKSILLVATDRTKEKEAENIVRANQTMAARILRIFRYRNHFIRFVKSFNMSIAAAREAANTDTPEQIRRDIHTLKGTADTFQLAELAQTLHVMETAMTSETDSGAVIDKYRPTLVKLFDEALESAREIIGDDFVSIGKVRTLSEERLHDFARRLKRDCAQGISPEQIYQSFLHDLVAVPIWYLLGDFAVTLQELADRYGKSIYPCSFLGTDFPILPEIYDPLFGSFTHIARNIIDHGVENPDLRVERGKDPKAAVTVRTETFRRNETEWFSIEFADDGDGLNVTLLRKKLREKLKAQDLGSLDDHALIQHVLDGHVSTKEQSTMLGGRGVGLNALKAEVMKLGGIITLFSVYGQGTRLKIELPLRNTLDND